MRATTRGLIGLAVAAAAGFLAVVGRSASDMPGDGSFVPAGIAAGVVAMVAAPGPAGFAAVLGGMIVGMSLTIGVVQFGTAVYTVLISYGAVLGVAFRRIAWPAGRPRRGDRVTWAWVGSAILLGAALAWIAVDMGRNPF